MPLRCTDPERGASVLAFDLSPESWRALEAENRRRRHLRMPCCSSEVTLRRSRLGTAHFAHKAIGACITAPETDEHLRLKRMAVEAARAAGWEAQTEVAGQTPEGEPWRADVLAWRGEERMAVEVQWSPQTDEETLSRQERYRLSGVRGLWLFRQADFPVSQSLPAARIGGMPEEGLTALLPGYRSSRPKHDGGQELPMAELLAAAFGGRLRWGLPLGTPTHFQLQVGRMFCWACGCETPIVTGLEVRAGRHGAHFTVATLGERPQLWERVRAWIPASFPSNVIRRRYSRTREESYLSNGCHHCDALIGAFYEHEAWDELEVVHEVTAPLDETWHAAMAREDDSGGCWGVF